MTVAKAESKEHLPSAGEKRWGQLGMAPVIWLALPQPEILSDSPANNLPVLSFSISSLHPPSPPQTLLYIEIPVPLTRYELCFRAARDL